MCDHVIIFSKSSYASILSSRKMSPPTSNFRQSCMSSHVFGSSVVFGFVSFVISRIFQRMRKWLSNRALKDWHAMALFLWRCCLPASCGSVLSGVPRRVSENPDCWWNLFRMESRLADPRPLLGLQVMYSPIPLQRASYASLVFPDPEVLARILWVAAVSAKGKWDGVETKSHLR